MAPRDVMAHMYAHFQHVNHEYVIEANGTVECLHWTMNNNWHAQAYSYGEWWPQALMHRCAEFMYSLLVNRLFVLKHKVIACIL